LETGIITGTWMDQILNLESLQLYEANGNPHGFPANMQKAIPSESSEERMERIATTLRMADNYTIVRRGLCVVM